MPYRPKKNDKPRPKRKWPEKKEVEEKIRLNRYIANAGICSRREADQLIAQGLIKVNGKVVTELGTKVGSADKVTYKDKALRKEKHSYILMNKPKDFITTVSDDRGRKTVIDLIKNRVTERVVPVGRLDKNTTGLLLLTNDGDLTKKLTHPSYEIQKLYTVKADRNITEKDLESLSEGLKLDDGFIRPDSVSRLKDRGKDEIGIELHSGRNRIVRRMMEHLGYKVIRLDRIMFAGLTKKDLPRGKWRELKGHEISQLKRLTNRK